MVRPSSGMSPSHLVPATTELRPGPDGICKQAFGENEQDAARQPSYLPKGKNSLWRFVVSIARKVIAVIDDDELMLDSLEQLLSSLGYQTELYESAEAFIEAAMRSRAACLIVDIMLGDITGVELGRQLSAMGFTFPVIFITGSDNTLVRKQAMELGCIAYLQKPFPANDLKIAITEAIG